MPLLWDILKALQLLGSQSLPECYLWVKEKPLCQSWHPNGISLKEEPVTITT